MHIAPSLSGAPVPDDVDASTAALIGRYRSLRAGG